MSFSDVGAASCAWICVRHVDDMMPAVWSDEPEQVLSVRA